MRVATLLRTGGEYNRWHVERLRAQAAKYMPNLGFVCLTDKPETAYDLPLIGDWPGYWSKPEMFRPEIPGALLYLDLDVTIIDTPTFSKMEPTEFFVLRAFEDIGLRWPERRNSSVMLIPQCRKPDLWATWMEGPKRWMETYKGGDDSWMSRHVESEALQDEYPDECVSYKYRVTQLGEITEDNKIVVFHGAPRPWQVAQELTQQTKFRSLKPEEQ